MRSCFPHPVRPFPPEGAGRRHVDEALFDLSDRMTPHNGADGGCVDLGQMIAAKKGNVPAHVYLRGPSI
jgi:hypothetical protein